MTREAAHALSREEIEAFKNYVDENTKAHEILQRVKGIFRDDQASYERLYLAPKIMNRKLRSFYARNHDIHKDERHLIERAYSRVISGKGFEDAAGGSGLKTAVYDIHYKEGKMPSGPLNFPYPDNIEGQDPLLLILRTLSEGEIYRNILEDDYSYRVIRLIRQRAAILSIEEIILNKRPFDEWLREEGATIGIEIRDSELKDRIRSRHADVWWVKIIS